MSKFIGCIGDLRKVIMSMKPYAHHLMSLKECQWKGLYEILFKMFSVHLILEHLVSLLPLIEHINHISTSLVIDKLYGGLSENNIKFIFQMLTQWAIILFINSISLEESVYSLRRGPKLTLTSRQAFNHRVSLGKCI